MKKYFILSLGFGLFSACGGVPGEEEIGTAREVTDSDLEDAKKKAEEFKNNPSPDETEDQQDNEGADNPDDQNNEGSNNEQGDDACDGSHPLIGKVATLSTLHHDVSGTATVIDNCTILIENFNYDGLGLAVFVYGGLDGDYRNSAGGFPLSDNILGTVFDNDDLVVKLPTLKTLDDLNGISVWCAAVGEGIDFGSGLFE